MIYSCEQIKLFGSFISEKLCVHPVFTSSPRCTGELVRLVDKIEGSPIEPKHRAQARLEAWSIECSEPHLEPRALCRVLPRPLLRLTRLVRARAVLFARVGAPRRARARVVRTAA